MLMMEDDAALLTQIANGDQRAMEAIYRKYSSIVYHFAHKTLHNPADAAEVLNEVMLEVWRKAATFSGKSKVKTWLISITHHKAVDLIRKKSRHDGVEEFHEETAVAPQCSLEQLKSGLEDKERVELCLNQLSQGHRQVVYLTFFEGLSYTDIGSVLDIPSGTVKTRMMHAKKQLMACLSGLVSATTARLC
jgi:RNA polymerase sigma-70 factor (ECF subfamily)